MTKPIIKKKHLYQNFANWVSEGHWYFFRFIVIDVCKDSVGDSNI